MLQSWSMIQNTWRYCGHLWLTAWRKLLHSSWADNKLKCFMCPGKSTKLGHDRILEAWMCCSHLSVTAKKSCCNPHKLGGGTTGQHVKASYVFHQYHKVGIWLRSLGGAVVTSGSCPEKVTVGLLSRDVQIMSISSSFLHVLFISPRWGMMTLEAWRCYGCHWFICIQEEVVATLKSSWWGRVTS